MATAADLRAARALCWEGALPIVFEAVDNELATPRPPPPLYVMGRRTSYLGALVPEILGHFSSSLAMPPSLDGGQGRVELWFEADGAPLRWHLPVGVLADGRAAGADADRAPLPWRVVVHFGSVAPAPALPSPTSAAAELHWMHALKQSLYLRHTSASAALGIAIGEAQRLWRATAGGTVAEYDAALGAARARRDRPNHIPVRVVLPGAPLVTLPYPGDVPVTLGAAVRRALPEGTACFEWDALGVRIHGVPADEDAPLLETWQAAGGPDGFLYATVRGVAEEG